MPDPNLNKDRMLDELLDGALAEYAQAEPRSGLENRILARLASREQAEPQWKWNRWMILGSASVALVFFAMWITLRADREIDGGRPTLATASKAPLNLGAERGARAPLFHKNAAMVHKSPESISVAMARTSRAKARVIVSSAHVTAEAAPSQDKVCQQGSAIGCAVVVRQAIFPSPSPLSDQERKLFAYLQATPREELVRNSKPDEPSQEPVDMNRTIFPEQSNSETEVVKGTK